MNHNIATNTLSNKEVKLRQLYVSGSPTATKAGISEALRAALSCLSELAGWVQPNI